MITSFKTKPIKPLNTLFLDEDFTFGMKKIHLSGKFGLPYLLRMFVRLPEILSFTHWSPRALDSIIRHAQDVVMFLNKNWQAYYDVDRDYEVATPEYTKRAWNNQATQ